MPSSAVAVHTAAISPSYFIEANHCSKLSVGGANPCASASKPSSSVVALECITRSQKRSPRAAAYALRAEMREATTGASFALSASTLMDAGAKWEPSEHSGGEGCGRVPGSVLGSLREVSTAHRVQCETALSGARGRMELDD